MARILALFLALTAPMGAFASSDERADPGKMDEIRATLTAEGYEVRKIEMEDGMIEVYALKNGQRFELYLDSDLNIVRSKTED